MKTDHGINNKNADQWIGQPVWVVLKDGTQYVGLVTKVENNEVILSAARGQMKLTSPPPPGKEVQVSGLFSALFGGGRPTNGGASGANAGGRAESGGFLGMFGQIIPNIRVGMNMLQMIMPLMGAFKI